MPTAGEHLAAEIDEKGSIGFDRFVELALYGPGGFFTAGRGAGRQGADFITSPEVGPLFGQVVANFLDAEWDRQGRPSPFTVVEVGAGRGTLARSVLRAEPACRPALELTLVERGEGLRDEHPDGVNSRADLPVGPVELILANELLDNIPVALARRRAGGWEELRVVRRGQAFGWQAAPLEAVALPDAPVGAIVPLQHRLADWVARARRRLSPDGVLLAIDYCTTTAELAERDITTWLRTYTGHQRGGDPLESPGSQDITCEVCLDQLPLPTETANQTDWLVAHGIDELVAEGVRIWRERAHRGDLAALVARSRVSEADALCDPAGLGAFTVMRWAAVT